MEISIDVLNSEENLGDIFSFASIFHTMLVETTVDGFANSIEDLVKSL